MGWNSWDCYGAAVTEQEIRGNAEYMAANLKSFGWEYVVVDIQWYEPGQFLRSTVLLFRWKWTNIPG